MTTRYTGFPAQMPPEQQAASSFWNARWRSKKLPRANIFQPFFGSMDPKELKIWPRNEELRELHASIQGASNTHIIVTGPTGAGKSTLVQRSYVDLYKAPYYQNVITFKDYPRFVVQLIESIPCPDKDLDANRSHAVQSLTDFLEQNFIRIEKSLTASAIVSRLEPTLEMIRNVVNAAADMGSRETPTLYIFDQIERHLILLSRRAKDSASHFNAYELIVLRDILRTLRLHPNVRTVLILREDFLYKSIELLLHGVTVRRADPDVFRLFLCFGINQETARDAIASVKRALNELEFMQGRYEQFAQATGLSTEMLSNTFLLQLTGYMIEHFYQTDPRVKVLLKADTAAKDVVVILFDYLIEGFSGFRWQHKSLTSEIIRVILYTIAVENRNTGLPVDAERVAALAHVPSADVESTFEYLIEAGVVDKHEEESTTIRFAHDILADFILRSEALSFNADLRVSIDRLSIEQVASSKLVRVQRWPDFMRDLATPNIGVLSIWIFYAYGIARLTSPSACRWLDGTISPHLPNLIIFRSIDCHNVIWYYAITFMMHCVWITYIYYLDRSYFNIVLHNNWTLRAFGTGLPVLGAFLGVMLGASPMVLVFPTFVVGTIMAILLILIAMSQPAGGQFAKMNMGWGLRTLFNMAFSIIMSILLVVVMSGGDETLKILGLGANWSEAASDFLGLPPKDLLQGLWVNLVALLMFYFWWHIRARQQSSVSAAFRLALHDRSTTGGAVPDGTLIEA